MNPCNIETIPELNLSSFLAILQSITRFEKAKNSVLPLPYVNANIFANKQWQDYNCSENDIGIIVEYYQKMFSIKQNIPNAHGSFGTFAEECYHNWKQSAKTVTFFTSGTTGAPKPCTHLESHLRQELLGVIPNVPNCKRALVTVPQHHLYGFTFGLLLPQALNIPVQTEAPFPAVIANILQKNDLLIAIPLLYNHLCDISGLMGDEISCISGTAPLAEGTFQKMLQKGFNFIEHFGSSELGVMCYRKKAHDPFTLLSHFIEVKADGSVDRMLPDGTIMHCPIQDNIEWIDERHLVPKGRKDSAVQIGGINVFAAHVSKIMESHPMIKSCLVRLMRPEEGNRLKAFVVPNSYLDENNLKNEIRSFIKSSLKEAERPAIITLGTKLPRNCIGKLADW